MRDYRRIMMAFDILPRAWRDLINEFGGGAWQMYLRGDPIELVRIAYEGHRLPTRKSGQATKEHKSGT